MMRLAALLLLLPTVFAAAPHAAQNDVQAMLDRRAAAMPGSAIAAVIIDRGGVSTYYAGTAGTPRSLDEHTLFEIGSVTKTFTATTLSALARRPVVKLSDPVSRYLPSAVRVPSRGGKAITLLSLATQHSGLPRLPSNMTSASAGDPYASYTEHDLLAFLDSYQLQRDPGASFEYSNVGFGLLGLALTRAAHERSYATLIQNYVFTPLRMSESEVALSLMPDARMAVGHNIDGDPEHTWDFTNAMAGAGAIRSDIHDMTMYLRCNLGDGPLAPVCLDAQRPRDTFTGYRIGLAWWTSDKNGMVQHAGDTAGYHAMVAMNAAHTKGVVVLSSGPAVADIAAHIVDQSVAVINETQPAPIATSQLAGYTGTYRNESAGITYEVTQQNGKLYARIAGQSAAEIFPSRWPDHFHYRVAPASIEFVRNDGEVTGLILTQSGRHVPVYRIRADGKPPATSLTAWFPAVAALDSATLQQYAGSYSLNGTKMTVSLTGGQVYAQIQGQPVFPIYASAKDEFFYKNLDAQITFERENGAVNGLVIHQNGRDFPAKRI